MKALLRVSFIVLLWIDSSVAGFNKCCPDGEVVQVELFEDNNLAPRKHFSCVREPLMRASFKRKRESDSYAINNSSDKTELIAYNILIDANSHWPSCGDNSFLSFSMLVEPMKVSQSASCVDFMSSNYFIFTCDERLEVASDFVDIYRLQKCCGNNFSYDIFGRQCVENNETTLIQEFSEFLNDKVVAFGSGMPECKPDDVLVEYHSHVHKLKIYESSLIITGTNSHGPDVLPHSSYCIESTLNSEINLPDGAEPSQFQLKASSKWIAKVCRPKSICREMPCVRKCCKEGQRMVFENETYCENHDAHLAVKFHFFDIRTSPESPDAMEPTEFGILMPRHCEKFHLEQEEEPHFYSGIDGSLFQPDKEKFYPNEEYCVDYFYYADEVDPSVDVLKVETFVCFNDDDDKDINLRFKIYASLLAISAVFLGITFIVYIFLPKLLNLHGKTLVSHVLSLFLAYSFLSAVQFATDVKMTYCKCIAFIVFFSFLSAFSWLNVMCLDIFWTFGSLRMSHGIRRTKGMKRFMCYSLYAWGFPCLLTIFTFMMDNYSWIPKKYKPNMGLKTCWFENASPGHVIFFLVPVGIQISINVVLFVITAIHCNRVKSEIHRMQMHDNCEQKKKRYIADKAIFLMNLKLFIVMGISWLLEIVATLLDGPMGPVWWYVSDAFNLLQGVLVFFIFVFKRKVLVAFQKKLGIRTMGLRPKAPGSTSTHMSTLELHSTSMGKGNGKMMKSNSSSTLTNANMNLIKH